MYSVTTSVVITKEVETAGDGALWLPFGVLPLAVFTVTAVAGGELLLPCGEFPGAVVGVTSAVVGTTMVLVWVNVQGQSVMVKVVASVTV